MQYTVKNTNSYNIHFIKTDKFKTVRMEVFFRDVADYQDYTYRLLLSKVMKNSTCEYKTKRLLTIAQQELYAINTHVSASRTGNFLYNSFGCEFLNERYTEAGMLEKSIKFLFDMIFKPNVQNGMFDAESIKQAKSILREEKELLKDEKRSYCLVKCLEALGDKEPFTYGNYADMTILEEITEQSLYEYYRNLLKKNIVDIYVIGDVNESTIEKIIAEQFLVNTIKKEKGSLINKHTNFGKKFKEIVETADVEQCKITIGAKLKDLTDFERDYVFHVANVLMGSGPDSYFFRIIREKESLCYYIMANYLKNDSLLLISSGVNRENVPKMLKGIKQIISDLSKGEFTSEDVRKAKEAIVTSIKSYQDNTGACIASCYASQIAGLPPLFERVTEYEKVDAKMIAQVYKKINLELIYILDKGEEHEKN